MYALHGVFAAGHSDVWCLRCSVAVQNLSGRSVNNHALPVHALPTSISVLAGWKVVLAAYLDYAGQHFDGLVCEVAPTQVQLHNGLIVAQALTQCLHAFAYTFMAKEHANQYLFT